MVATSGLVVSDLVFDPSDLLVDTGDSYTQAPYLLLKSKKSFRCLQSTMTGANYTAVVPAAGGETGGGDTPAPYVPTLQLVLDLDPLPQSNGVISNVTARLWTDKNTPTNPTYLATHSTSSFFNGAAVSCNTHSGSSHIPFSAAYLFNDDSPAAGTHYGARSTYRQWHYHLENGMFLGFVFYANSDFLAADYSAAQYYVLCIQKISDGDKRAKLFLATGLTYAGLSLIGQSDNINANIGNYNWHNYITMDADGDTFTVSVGDTQVYTITDATLAKTSDRKYWGPIWYANAENPSGSYMPYIASENPSSTDTKYYWKFWVKK